MIARSGVPFSGAPRYGGAQGTRQVSRVRTGWRMAWTRPNHDRVEAVVWLFAPIFLGSAEAMTAGGVLGVRSRGADAGSGSADAGT